MKRNSILAREMKYSGWLLWPRQKERKKAWLAILCVVRGLVCVVVRVSRMVCAWAVMAVWDEEENGGGVMAGSAIGCAPRGEASQPAAENSYVSCMYPAGVMAENVVYQPVSAAHAIVAS